MIKNYMYLVVFLFGISLNAQEPENNAEPDPTEQKTFDRDLDKNEISFNVFNIIVFGAFDARYERVLTDNTSLGFGLFFKFMNNSKNDDVDLSEAYLKDFSFTTRYKYFFGDRIARGFYVQGFMMISNGENQVEVERYNSNGQYYYYDYTEVDYTDAAIGFGIGGKFVSKNGFLLDLSLGIGRNLFNADSPTIVALFNVDIGYRF